MEHTSDGDHSDYGPALADLEQSEKDARLQEPGPLERFRQANQEKLDAAVTVLE